MSGYYPLYVGQAYGVASSGLTVREVDGTPTGTCSTLVFPNGSVGIVGTTATITLAGSGDMVLASAQTVSGAKTFLDSTLLLRNVANTFSAQFSNTNTAARTYTLPNASGTVALTSDLSSYATTAAVAAGYQPLDADLTSIAGLSTTSFGRSLLTQVDAAATRTTIGAGTSSFDGVYSSLSGIPSTFTPTAHNQAWSTITSTPTTLTGYGITDAATSTHVHGNITNAGAIGATANLPLITTTSGVVTVGAFGTSANSFCQGNDSRLSDSRTPLSHVHAGTDITSGTVDPARLGSGTSITTKFLRGDSTWQTISGGGDALTSGNLSQFAATTSAQLAGVISDETGSGALVFATSPTFVTPLLGTPTSGVLTNCTGTASGLTAGNVTTNANLTGHVTSVGNAAVLGSFTKAQLDTAVSDGNVLYVGDVTSNATHTGDVTGATALTIKTDVALAGNPTTTTQTATDNSTRIATTAHVKAQTVALPSIKIDTTATGAKALMYRVPYACTITGWEMVSATGVSGSVVIDIWKDTYANFPPTVADSITGSAKPTITTATKAASTTLTGWTTALAAGDYLEVYVDSSTTITNVTLTPIVTRT